MISSRVLPDPARLAISRSVRAQPRRVRWALLPQAQEHPHRALRTMVSSRAQRVRAPRATSRRSERAATAHALRLPFLPAYGRLRRVRRMRISSRDRPAHVRQETSHPVLAGPVRDLRNRTLPAHEHPYRARRTRVSNLARRQDRALPVTSGSPLARRLPALQIPILLARGHLPLVRRLRKPAVARPGLVLPATGRSGRARGHPGFPGLIHRRPTRPVAVLPGAALAASRSMHPKWVVGRRGVCVLPARPNRPCRIPHALRRRAARSHSVSPSCLPVPASRHAARSNG